MPTHSPRSLGQFSPDEQAKAASAMRAAKDQAELVAVISGFNLPKDESADLWDMAMAERLSPESEVGDSALTRFAKGVWRNVNPMAVASTIQQTYQDPVGVVGGIARGVYDNASQGVRDIGAGNLGEAAESFVKAVPLVGGALGSVIDKVRGGDLAGAAGETVGLAAPYVSPRKMATTGLRAVADKAPSSWAGRLEKGAEQRVVETLSPHTGPNKRNFANMTRKQADTLLKRGDVDAMSPGGAFRRIEQRYETASDAWATAEDAVDLRKTSSTVDIWNGLQEKIDALTTKDKTVPEGWREQVATLKRAQQDIGSSDAMSFEDLRKFRRAYDAQAKPIYSPSMTSDYFKKNAEATAASKVAGVIRDVQAQAEPAMAAANAEFHIYQSMMDVARAIAETETTRPSVFRKLTTRAIGLVEGFRHGGATGAAVGLVGAASVEAATSAGITTKLRTAQLMSDLANALRKGKRRDAEASMFSLRKILKVGGQAAILNQNDRERMDMAPASPPQTSQGLRGVLVDEPPPVPRSPGLRGMVLDDNPIAQAGAAEPDRKKE